MGESEKGLSVYKSKQSTTYNCFALTSLYTYSSVDSQSIYLSLTSNFPDQHFRNGHFPQPIYRNLV